MKKENTAEPELTDNLETVTVDELLLHVVQDIAAGESASFTANEFFDEFVYRNREEVPQILMLLDMPSETIIQSLIDVQMQAIELIRQNAPAYLNELRVEVKSRLAEMAQNNSN